jgi:hypothetical protein
VADERRGEAARIGHEMWHSKGKFHSRDRARSTREGEGESDTMSLLAAGHKCLSSGRTTQARKSPQAQHTAAPPRPVPSGLLRVSNFEFRILAAFQISTCSSAGRGELRKRNQKAGLRYQLHRPKQPETISPRVGIHRSAGARVYL